MSCAARVSPALYILISACTATPPPAPDAPLTSCADLGCGAHAICSSPTACTCHGEACEPRPVTWRDAARELAEVRCARDLRCDPDAYAWASDEACIAFWTARICDDGAAGAWESCDEGYPVERLELLQRCTAVAADEPCDVAIAIRSCAP